MDASKMFGNSDRFSSLGNRNVHPRMTFTPKVMIGQFSTFILKAPSDDKSLHENLGEG